MKNDNNDFLLRVMTREEQELADRYAKKGAFLNNFEHPTTRLNNLIVNLEDVFIGVIGTPHAKKRRTWGLSDTMGIQLLIPEGESLTYHRKITCVSDIYLHLQFLSDASDFGQRCQFLDGFLTTANNPFMMIRKPKLVHPMYLASINKALNLYKKSA